MTGDWEEMIEDTVDRLGAHGAEVVSAAENMRGVCKAIDDLDDRGVGANEPEGQEALEWFVGVAKFLKGEVRTLAQAAGEL